MLRPALLLLPLFAAPFAAVATPPPSSAAAPAPSRAQDEADADTVLLRFDWPAEGKVGVTAFLAKSTGSARFSYVLSWGPDADAAETDPGARIVRIRDLAFLSLNDTQPGDPEFDAIAARLGPALAAVPPFRITGQGEYAGLLDLDAALDALEETYAGLGDAALESLTNSLSDPMLRSGLENSTAEDWAWWGAFWNEYEATPDEALSADISLPSGVTGKPLRGELTMSCLGVGERDGLATVRMNARTEYDPDDMLRVTLAMLRSASKQKVPDDAIKSVARTDEVDGVYVIDDLRPLEVRWTQTITVDDGSGPKETVETKRWRFDWSI